MVTKLAGALFAGKKGAKTVDVPLIFGDIIDHNLTGDFTATGTQLDKGVVLIGGATAGLYTCVTFAQYMAHGGDVATTPAEHAAAIAAAIAATDTVNLYLGIGEASKTTVVFIDATGAASAAVNIGLF